MLVNFERRICFLAHARTASRATTQVLKERCGFVQVTDHHEGWEPPGGKLYARGEPGDTERRWDDIFSCDGERGFLYLMTIRNPWDVIASWWVDSANHISYQKIGPKWFEAFRTLHPKLFPPTDLWPYLENEPPGPIGLIMYEEIDTVWAWLAWTLRFPYPGELPVIGKTEKRMADYRTYYDDESRDWVAKTFPNAVKAGNYEF